MGNYCKRTPKSSFANSKCRGRWEAELLRVNYFCCMAVKLNWDKGIVRLTAPVRVETHGTYNKKNPQFDDRVTSGIDISVLVGRTCKNTWPYSRTPMPCCLLSHVAEAQPHGRSLRQGKYAQRHPLPTGRPSLFSLWTHTWPECLMSTTAAAV